TSTIALYTLSLHDALPILRILLAEDEKKVSHFIRKALREAGYAVDEVHDGTTAFDLARTTPYDAIVLDVMMPGRDGLSILKLLRSEEHTSELQSLRHLVCR